MILLIYCSGGFGREIYDLASRINEVDNKWEKIEFIDDIRKEKIYYGTQVYSFEEIKKIYSPEKVECTVANGEPEYREILWDKLKEEGYRTTILIDPTAVISPTATIKTGVIVGAYSFISSNTVIEENVAIEQNVLIGHDVKINKNSVLSGGTGIGGFSNIGEKNYIGIHASIKDRVSIGQGGVIGMGSVVYNDISEGMIVLGNPARAMKENKDKKIFK